MDGIYSFGKWGTTWFTTISSSAASAEGSSIYLQQGVTADVEGLLYGLMLRSGNDAAYALAEHAGGSIEGFVDLMNDKCTLLWIKGYCFYKSIWPSRRSAPIYSLRNSVMMSHAMSNEKFKKIASTDNYNYEMNGESYCWQNKHRMVVLMVLP